MTTRYEPNIDVDAIVALDVHAHVERDGHDYYALDDELLDASAKYFRSDDNRTRRWTSSLITIARAT